MPTELFFPPMVCWLSFLFCMKVWVLWVNICFFLQRQKSCPSESASVCKRCGANNSGLCCSTQSVEYVKRRVWLAQRLSGEFICCQRSMSGLQSMPISFIGFSLLLCYHMHHHHQYNITFCGSMAMSVGGSTTLVQAEIYQQLLDGLCWNLVQIFMVPRGWSPLTLVITWLFL